MFRQKLHKLHNLQSCKKWHRRRRLRRLRACRIGRGYRFLWGIVHGLINQVSRLQLVCHPSKSGQLDQIGKCRSNRGCRLRTSGQAYWLGSRDSCSYARTCIKRWPRAGRHSRWNWECPGPNSWHLSIKIDFQYLWCSLTPAAPLLQIWASHNFHHHSLWWSKSFLKYPYRYTHRSMWW